MNDTPRVTVPVEPTEAMMRAWHRSAWPQGPEVSPMSQAGLAFNRHYAAMLSAAPAPEGGAVAMIRALLDHIDRETCHHDNLKRGGVQWTICEDCDRKWADDQGGFKPHVDAPPVAAARLYLAALATRSDGKPEGGAVKGPGDYTMALTEPQAFERFPALASHIERMAVGRSVGSLIEWDAFLRELNAALATREEAPAEAGELVADFTRSHPSGLDDSTYEQIEDALDRADAPINGPDGKFLTLAQRVEAIRAQPPSREDAQPVAWYRGDPTSDDLEIGFGSDGFLFDKSVWRPLYTHPAPDALRVAELEATGLNWIVAKGQLSEDEPPYGCQIMDGEEVLAEGEDVTLSAAIEIALSDIAALQAEQKGGA